MYWNGSAFHIELNQTDHPTSWNTGYVGHFFWTKTASASYASSYSDGTCTTSDVPFFAESKGGLTVDGQDGLYALSSAEWEYLIQSRTNASNLCKYGVTVSNGGTSYTNCLIIAPDNYSGTALSSITDWSLSNINSLGLVCLPAAGEWYVTHFSGDGSVGNYWSSTPHKSNEGRAYFLVYYSSYVELDNGVRGYGLSVRLVK